MIDPLGELFARFDALAAQYGVEKIKTIGDGYVVAGGVPEPRSDHAAAVVKMALAMREARQSDRRRSGRATTVAHRR
jgi:adenylate cyclase